MKLSISRCAAMALLLGGSVSLSAAEKLFKPVSSDLARATLTSLDDSLVKRPGEVSKNHVQINRNVLTQSAEQVEINLRDGLSITLDKQSARLNNHGSLVWHGEKAGRESLTSRSSQLKKRRRIN